MKTEWGEDHLKCHEKLCAWMLQKKGAWKEQGQTCRNPLGRRTESWHACKCLASAEKEPKLCGSQGTTMSDECLDADACKSKCFYQCAPMKHLNCTKCLHCNVQCGRKHLNQQPAFGSDNEWIEFKPKRGNSKRNFSFEIQQHEVKTHPNQTIKIWAGEKWHGRTPLVQKA